MEKKMKIEDSILIKVIILALLSVIIYKLPNRSPETTIWLFSVVGLLAYLMFGFFFDRLENRQAKQFMVFSTGFGVSLLIVFFISLFDVFTGPLGPLCGGPFLLCSIVIIIFSLTGLNLITDDKPGY